MPNVYRNFIFSPPTVYRNFTSPPAGTSSIGDTVTAGNIITRLITALQGDEDIADKLPAGTTLRYIIPDGAGGSGGVTVAAEIIREDWKMRAMGGPGVGSSSLDLTVGVVVQVQQSDKAGTPYITKKQETDITDQLRSSILKLTVDAGTPRLWVDIRPGISQFSNNQGVQRGVTLVNVKSTHVRNPS